MNPPDSEFRYLGFTEGQIRLLENEPDEMRLIVYEEAIKRFMSDGTSACR